MRKTAVITLVCTIAAFAAQAPAVIIQDLVTPGGVDSGWSAILPNTATSIIVDSVGTGFVRLEIFKSFTCGPQDGQFSVNDITFFQRLDDAHTRANIQITDETIHNMTGYAWTDYYWNVSGQGALDRTATEGSGFSYDPFTVLTWSDSLGAGKYRSLTASGGVIENEDTFSPGLNSGRLVIQADLSGAAAANISFKQNPIPEPSMMAILLVGACGCLVRTRRSRTIAR